MSKIAVARLVAVGEPLEVGTAERPAPGPKDVLVKVEAASLVPNSMNVISGKTPFTLPELPVVFGLDAAGTIEAVGEHVLNLKVGDRVYVDPYMTCGTCRGCRRGYGCEYGCLRSYMASTDKGGQLINQLRTGALAEYLIAPDRSIAVLPEGIDLKTASRFGYLGTSYAALKAGEFGPGQTLLINGVTGTLGVAAVAIALGLGATKILGIGRNPERLEQARQLDPTRVQTQSSEDDVDLVEWVQDATAGAGVNVFYDCLGVGGDANSTNELIRAVQPGGRAVLAAGGAEGKITQSYAEAMSRSVAVLGSGWANAGQFDEMADLIGSGVIDLSFLTARTFTLDEVNDAFAFVGDRPGGFTNVVVLPQEHR